jgi:hypothetical protein
LAVLVEKTGGPQEHAAFAFLRQHLLASGVALAPRIPEREGG